MGSEGLPCPGYPGIAWKRLWKCPMGWRGTECRACKRHPKPSQPEFARVHMSSYEFSHGNHLKSMGTGGKELGLGIGLHGFMNRWTIDPPVETLVKVPNGLTRHRMSVAKKHPKPSQPDFAWVQMSSHEFKWVRMSSNEFVWVLTYVRLKFVLEFARLNHLSITLESLENICGKWLINLNDYRYIQELTWM